MAHTMHVETQQHPIKLYLVVWGWLFVLSTLSYLVDYFGLQGYLRWSLILLFMMLKAGLIVAVFMHMAWERLTLIYAILIPPAVLLVFVGIMVFESNYTFINRLLFFGPAQSFSSGEAKTARSAGSEPDQDLSSEAVQYIDPRLRVVAKHGAPRVRCVSIKTHDGS